MAPPCFHPKAVLLTGETEAQLYIGSGNLTHSGYGRNREVFESWTVTEHDASVPRAFETFRAFVSSVVRQRLRGDPPSAVQAVLEAVFGARALRKSYLDETDIQLLSSPGALFSRLPDPPSPATSLTLVAPSFDRSGSIVVALADKLRAKHFEVITDFGTTNLTSEALSKIEGRGGRLCRFDEERILHAKVISASGDGWQLAVTGSANLSGAAWWGHNAELIVVRQDAAALPVQALLDALPRLPLTDVERAGLRPWKGDGGGQPRGPEIVDARWISNRQAQLSPLVQAASVERVELFVTPVPVAIDHNCTDSGDIVATVPAESGRGRTTALRLVDENGVGPWCVVHDTDELAERAQDPGRLPAALQNLLANEAGYDAPEAERLLALMTRVWRDRHEANSRPDLEDSGTEEDNRASAGIKTLHDDDFTTPTRSVPVGGPSDAGSPAFIPSLLLRRLLFGSDNNSDADGAGDGESAGSDNTDEDELEANLPPVPSGPAPVRSPRVREAFTSAAAAALEQYLKLLLTETRRSAGRLLEDMQVLVATLHYGLRVGALSPLAFRNSSIRLFRAFLGRRSAPFPRALERIPEADRERVWRHAPLLTYLALATYNLALSDLAVTTTDDESPVFVRKTGLLFWVRHVIAHAPRSIVDETLARVSDDARALTRGELWVPSFELIADALPFESFTRDLLEGALAMLQLDDAVRERLRATQAGSLSDGDEIIGLGRDGCLAIGHVESEGLFNRAFLYDGAYQRPGAQDPWENMCVTDTSRRVISLDEARKWCAQLGNAYEAGLRTLESVR
jgi:hypothetical protein